MAQQVVRAFTKKVYFSVNAVEATEEDVLECSRVIFNGSSRGASSAQVQFRQAVISAAEKVALDPEVQRAAQKALLEGGFVLVDGPSCLEIEGLGEEDAQPGVPLANAVSKSDRLETKDSYQDHPQPLSIAPTGEDATPEAKYAANAFGVPSACPQMFESSQPVSGNGVVRSPSSEPGFPFPNETQEAETKAPGILARLVAWFKSWFPWLSSSQEAKAPAKAPQMHDNAAKPMPQSFANMVIGLAVGILALVLLKKSLPVKHYANLVRLLVL